jgi:autotransporter-associated beta strand protein
MTPVHKRPARRSEQFGAAGWLIALLGLMCDPVDAATNLFTSGQAGYNTYRIPALYETLSGTLLAFCEGRKNSSSDTGDIDTLLRRSFDGGQTWTTQQVIWSDGTNTCGNPTTVQDRTNNRLWLFLTWNNGGDTQSEISGGTSVDVRKIYSCFSDDNGATWSAPVNRFAEVQPASTRWDATGPGCGIQMVSGAPGRLIIPANGRNIQSDDHGTTWSQSAWVPGGSSESQEVEISNGVLLRNDRASGGNTQYNARIFCRSSNQGASWGALEIREDLTCPVCQASTITVEHPAGLNGRMVVFANPSSTTRDHMTIQCSLDDGVTWPFSQLVYSGSSAYCCLTKVGTTNIGLLYERDSYGKITFDKFAINALVPNAPTNQPPQTWDGGAGLGNESWQQPNNWTSNSTPSFDSGLHVVFHAAGAGNLTNAIGGNRTLRSLSFNELADASVGIYLAEKISAPATNYVLTFDAFLGNASNTIASGAAGNITIGLGGLGSIMLANDLVITHNGNGTLTFERPINEAVAGKGLTKTGSGALILRQNSTYTGTTTLDAGTLRVGADAACGTGPLILNGGTLFASDSGAVRAPTNNLTIGGNVTFGQSSGGSGSLTFSGAVDLGGTNRMLTINNTNTTFAGVISNGGLTKAGSGTLTLTGADTYTGLNTLFTGTLQLGAGGASGSLADASAIAIGPNAIFQINRSSSDTDFPNSISGIGTLLKTVGGGVEFGLTGTNSFSGLIDIREGKIALAGANSENGSPKVNVAAGATLSIGGGFIGGTATIGSLSGAGRVDCAFNSGAGTRTLQVDQATDATFSGITLDGSSGRVLALTKTGPATLSLAGTNAYSGPTTLSDGTLLVTGNISNSAVTVKTGATLAGTGFLGGPVTVQAGGTLEAGPMLGTLTLSNSLVLEAGSFTALEINATNGLSDRVQGLTNASYAGTLVVSNLAGPGTLSSGQAFRVFNAVPGAAGNFNNINSPATPGATWRFDPATGFLTVLATTATYPTNLSFALSNGVLSLNWPDTHLGWIAQSNVSSLLTSAAWHEIPGSSNATALAICPDPSRSNVFYRLISP